MQDKYSLAKCEHYGRRLAARLSQQLFEAQPHPYPAARLDGPALLALTPVRQVNLLVLRQLLSCWQQQALALRSPYFDFEAAPVRAALSQLLNVLSRHISFDRAALEPLLAQAVTDTLQLAADPAAALQHLLPEAPPAEALPKTPAATPAKTAAAALLTAADLRAQLRYLDQAKPFFELFFDGLPAGPLDRAFVTQRFELHLNAHRAQLPTVGAVVASLRPLLPLTEADLWDDGPVRPAVGAARGLSQGVPVLPSPSAPGAAASAGALAGNVAGGAVSPLSTSVADRAVVSSETAPATLPETVLAPAPATRPLHEKLREGQPAAAGSLAAEPRETVALAPSSATLLAERAAPPVSTLREAISINQRFSFINELFNGENMEYHAFVQQLDQQPSAAEALALVRQQQAAHPEWARKEEHVAKLLKLLERRFAAA